MAWQKYKVQPPCTRQEFIRNLKHDRAKSMISQYGCCYEPCKGIKMSFDNSVYELRWCPNERVEFRIFVNKLEHNFPTLMALVEFYLTPKGGERRAPTLQISDADPSMNLDAMLSKLVPDGYELMQIREESATSAS